MEPAPADTSEPGDTSAPATSPEAASGRSRRGYWVPGVIALVALLAIGLAVGAGDLNHQAPRTLHGSDVSSQIGLAIQVQRGWPNPPKVQCPNREPVREGWRFTCYVVVANRTEAVDVVEVDSRGNLRWSIVG